MRLSEKNIQLALLMYLLERRKIVYGVPNIFADAIGESDLLAVDRSNYLLNFEIKISRSDFKNELKKRRTYFIKSHISNGNIVGISRRFTYGIPNYFYYVVPENLITKEDVETVYKDAGLIYVAIEFKRVYKDGRYIKRPLLKCYVKKSPKRFHDGKVPDKVKERMSIGLFWRWWKLNKNS